MSVFRQFFFLFFFHFSFCGFTQLSLSGTVLSEKNDETVAYAHVGIMGTSIGTTTNAEGKFILNIPAQYREDTLFISHLNYKTHYFKYSTILSDFHPLIVYLEEALFNLKEVVVSATGITPFEVLSEAVESTNSNSHSPVILFTYHREFSKKNNHFNYYADALVDYYMSNGKKKSDIEVRVNESRVRKVKVKINEGFDHNFSHQFNIRSLAKYQNADKILKFVSKDFCDFKLTEVDSKNNEVLFCIQFKPKLGEQKFYYEGTIYIDKKTMIIRSFECHIPDSHKNFTPKASLLALKSQLTSAHINIQYSTFKGKCYLSGVRLDAIVSVLNKNKINVDYEFISEMSTREILIENVKLFDKGERFKYNHLYYMAGHNQGNNFETEFWRDQNGLLATTEEKKIIESFNEDRK